MGKSTDYIIDISKLNLNEATIVTDLEKLSKQLQRQFRNATDKQGIAVLPTNIHFYGFFEKCIKEFLYETKDEELKLKQRTYIGESLFYLIPVEDRDKVQNLLEKDDKVYIKFQFQDRESEKFIHLPWELLIWNADYHNLPGELIIPDSDHAFVSRIIYSRSKDYSHQKELTILVVDTRESNENDIQELKDFFEKIQAEKDISLEYISILEEESQKYPFYENVEKFVKLYKPNIIHFVDGVTFEGALDLPSVHGNNHAGRGNNWLWGKDDKQRDFLSRLLIFQQSEGREKVISNKGFEKMVYHAVRNGCSAASFIPHLKPQEGTENKYSYLMELYEPILNKKPLEESFAAIQRYFYQKECSHLPSVFFNNIDIALIERSKIEKSQSHNNTPGPVPDQSELQELSKTQIKNSISHNISPEPKRSERQALKINIDELLEKLRINSRNQRDYPTDTSLETKLNRTRAEFKKYLGTNQKSIEKYFKKEELLSRINIHDANFCNDDNSSWICS